MKSIYQISRFLQSQLSKCQSQVKKCAIRYGCTWVIKANQEGDEINKKKHQIPSKSLTIKQWSSSSASQHIKSSEGMAIIRIVLQVKQQQFRTDYIEQPRENQPHQTQKIQQMSHQNNRFSNSRREEEESRPSRRGPLRRQVHMLNQEEETLANRRQVPQEIRPALDMIELQQQNQVPTSNRLSATQLFSHYQTIDSSRLQARLCSQPPTTTTKQTVFQKILIYGIVWNKDINGLFDYQQKDKNQKSTIVIEENVKSHINFVTSNSTILPCEQDCFLLIFKTKLKKVVYERSLLRDIRIAALRRQLVQSNQTHPREERLADKEFLCAFKLVMNAMTNQFTIKVYSFDELNDQVKMISKKSEQTATKKIESREQFENLQLQPSQTSRPNSQVKPQPSQNPLPTQLPNPSSSQSQKCHSIQPYFIIRTLSKNSPTQLLGCKLYPGDLIKMGKIQFKVISIDGISIQDKNNEYDRRAIEVTQINEEQEKQVQCKYCLGGKSQQPNNFFVHLCNCRGHIGYVHYECLTRWTTTKSSIETAENVKMYYLEKMRCEVCTKDFPKYFRYDGKLYHILPIDLPEKHLMLVDVSQKQQANTAVITAVENKPIVIGRGRSAHLRVTDITVSRQHANITRIGQDYYIKDCKSKFGTLVRSFEKEIETEIEHKKGFQINNVIFTVQIIKKEVEKQNQAQKSCEKVHTFESIKEEKQASTEVNQSMRQNSLNSMSTMLKRLSESERNQGQSFDLQKLNPHSNSIRQIKNNAEIQQYNNTILQQQDQQTRSTKKDIYSRQLIAERLERASQLRRQLHKRMSQQEKQQQDIELQNYQNTTNINNHHNELIHSQTNDKPSRTRSRRIRFEEDEDHQQREN